jgi:integrase/recombinase XerD
MTEEPHVRRDRRHDKAKRIEKLVPVEPGTLGAAALAYLEDLRVRNFSPNTVRSARTHVRLFVVWCHERGIAGPGELTLSLLRRYQAHLFHHRREDGRRLSFQSQFDRLGGVRRFCRWLAEHGHLAEDPSRRLSLPRVEKRLPRGILTPEEAEAILAQPDVSTTQGLRDRALLELLYATGMRRGEVERLRVEDLDFAGGVVRIDQGKGKKDRLVPLSERAAAWLQKYLDHARAELLRSPFDGGEVFLGRWGRPLAGGHMGKLVRQYVEASGIGKPGACHMFRHTMATLMLEGGADIRYIQHMLGHESLQSTESYTHVAIPKLKEVHAATHPAARLARRYRPDLVEQRADPAEELLTRLAAEAAAEETEEAQASDEAQADAGDAGNTRGR